MTPKDILVGIRQLYDDPTHWHKGNLANDADGNETKVNGNDAVSWCLLGAFVKIGCASDENVEAHNVAVKTLISSIENANPNLSLIGWNDHPKRTYEEVIGTLDKAIEKLS